MTEVLDRRQLWLLQGLVAEGAALGGREIAPKASLFIDAYLVSLNATKAATEAGYSPRTARQAGSRLLSDVVIRGEMRRRLEARHQASQITVEGILEQLRRLAHADMRTAYRPDGSFKAIAELPDDIAARIAGLETEETLTVDGLDLSDDQLRAVRAVLNLDRVAELVLVRVVKVKFWDPNKAVEMLGRYRKMLGADAPPPAGAMLQLPESAWRPGDRAILIDGTADQIDSPKPTNPEANGVRREE
jgi:hypothetical protein